MDNSQSRHKFRSSTPIRSQRPTSAPSELDELQRNISDLALENEQLNYELDQVRAANEQLMQMVQEKDEMQTKLRQQLETVTQTADALYNKLRALKCRYYEEMKANNGLCYDGSK